MVQAGDTIFLVAAQRAFDPELVADEVLVTGAVLALAVGARTHGEVERAPGQLALPGPARIGAPVAAVQVDHATGVQGLACTATGTARNCSTERSPAYAIKRRLPAPAICW